MPTLIDSINQAKVLSLQQHAKALVSKIHLPFISKATSSQQRVIDLELLTKQFLANQSKTLLLQGSAGTGKTMFCHQLMAKLLESKELTDIFPLYISFRPEDSKNKNLIVLILQDQGFSAEQIAELKQTQKFLFIFDDFDQLGFFQNIYSIYQLDQWQAKVIVTCRPEYFITTRDYCSYFVPYQNSKPQSHFFKEINLNLLNRSLWLSLKDKPAEEFFSNWIAYHEEKYKFNSVFEKELLEYCIAIAHEMQQKKTTKIVYKPASRLFGDLKNDWQKYFDPKFTAVRMASPIIKTGENQYEFINRGLIPYLAAKKTLEEKELISRQNSRDEKQVIIKNDTCLLNHSLNQKLFTHNSNLVRFIADRVWEKTVFKNELFNLILASRQDEKMAIAASNAITILNMAKISFSGMDLTNIQVSNAYLTGVNFHQTCLQGANLTGVKLANAIMLNANLCTANMENVDFSENPYMKCMVGDAAFLEEKIIALSLKSEDFDSKVLNINNLVTHEKLIQINHGLNLLKFFLSKNAKYLLIYGETTEIDEKVTQLWSVLTGNLITKWNRDSNINLFAIFSSDNQWLVTTENQSINVISLQHFKLLQQIDIFPKESFDENHIHVCFSLDSCLLVCSNAIDVFIYRVGPAKNPKIHFESIFSLQRKIQTQEYIYSLCIDVESSLLFTGHHKDVCVWNINTGEKLTDLRGHGSTILTLDYSSKNKILVSGGNDCTIRLWDIVNLKPIWLLANLALHINKLILHPFLPLVVSISYDRISYWNFDDNAMTISNEELFFDLPVYVAYDVQNNVFAIYSGQRINIWNGRHSISSISIKAKLAPHIDKTGVISYAKLAFNSKKSELDICFLFAEKNNNKIFVFKLDMQKYIILAKKQVVINHHIAHICFHKENYILAFSDRDNNDQVKINIFCLKTYSILDAIFYKHIYEVVALTFSNRENYLAIIHANGNVIILDIKTKQKYFDISFAYQLDKDVGINNNDQNLFDYDLSNRFLAFSGGYGTSTTLEIYDFRSNRCYSLLTDDKLPINYFCFISSSLIALTFSLESEGFLAIYDLVKQETLTYFKAHNHYIVQIIRLDNGKIATVSSDYSIKIWYINYSNFSLQLINVSKPLLNSYGCNLTNVKNLSKSNLIFLMQNGAFIEDKSQHEIIASDLYKRKKKLTLFFNSGDSASSRAITTRLSYESNVNVPVLNKC